MAQQLTQLLTPFHLLSDEEKRKRIQRIQYNRSVVLPYKVKKEVKKKEKTKDKKIVALLGALSKEELIKLLGDMKKGKI